MSECKNMFLPAFVFLILDMSGQKMRRLLIPNVACFCIINVSQKEATPHASILLLLRVE
jgi:hypothetical protein